MLAGDSAGEEKGELEPAAGALGNPNGFLLLSIPSFLRAMSVFKTRKTEEEHEHLLGTYRSLF